MLTTEQESRMMELLEMITLNTTAMAVIDPDYEVIEKPLPKSSTNDTDLEDTRILLAKAQARNKELEAEVAKLKLQNQGFNTLADKLEHQLSECDITPEKAAIARCRRLAGMIEPFVENEDVTATVYSEGVISITINIKHAHQRSVQYLINRYGQLSDTVCVDEHGEAHYGNDKSEIENAQWAMEGPSRDSGT